MTAGRHVTRLLAELEALIGDGDGEEYRRRIPLAAQALDATREHWDRLAEEYRHEDLVLMLSHDVGGRMMLAMLLDIAEARGRHLSVVEDED